MAQTSAALARSPKKAPVSRNAVKKPTVAALARTSLKSLPPAAQPGAGEPCVTLADVVHSRTLFWQDCVRQMLTGLSMIQAHHPELFDGRTAILTHGGERIPIAEVFPLFACGVPTPEQAKAASIAVECTVFRVRTPSGEMFTLPVHEVRALHSLTPELIKELEQTAMTQGPSENGAAPGPFGFAAYSPRPSQPAAPGSTRRRASLRLVACSARRT
jgi:hypothetical protein